MSISKMVDYKMQCPDCDDGKLLKDSNSDTFWCTGELKWMDYEEVKKKYAKKRDETRKLNGKHVKRDMKPWTFPSGVYKQFREEKQ
jgi:hypothetical protein